MKKIFLLFCLITVFCNGCFQIDKYSEKEIARPESADLITRKIILDSYRQTFAEYDRNRNGTVEFYELKGAPNAFRIMDINHDNKLTFAEVVSEKNLLAQQLKYNDYFYNDLFFYLDTNHDQKLSGNEINFIAEGEPAVTENIPASLNIYPQKNYNSEQFREALNNSYYKYFKNNAGANHKPGKKAVILLHGYITATWLTMYGIYNNLNNNGYDVYPINIFPNINDIKEQAALLANRIDELKKKNDIKEINFVCHSMGGLLARYYINNFDKTGSTRHFVSIVTPHYGTYMAYIGPGEAARQMEPESEFIRELNSVPLNPNVIYTSIWTKTDQIVIPYINAQLMGSRIMPDIPFSDHFIILWFPETFRQVREGLAARRQLTDNEYSYKNPTAKLFPDSN
jgi:triacylglycerol lipase